MEGRVAAAGGGERQPGLSAAAPLAGQSESEAGEWQGGKVEGRVVAAGGGGPYEHRRHQLETCTESFGFRPQDGKEGGR